MAGISIGPGFVTPGYAPALGASPKADANLSKETWTLSFKHWRQITYFGLSEITNKDVADLLTGIKEIEPVLSALREGETSRYKAYHYHKVDWALAKIKFHRSNLDWLPKDILENEDDFPIYQMALGKGTYRILGYFWENIFHVVLIDPHHNAQRSEGFETGCQCHEVIGTHHQLLRGIKDLHEDLESHSICTTKECSFANRISRLHDAYALDGIIYLPNDCISEATKLIQQGACKDMAEVFMTGVLYVSQSTSQNPSVVSSEST